MKEKEPTLFDNAFMVWHMADTHNSSGMHTPLTINGDIKFGVKLEGAELDASIKRRGDGYVALFDGKSWLSTDSVSMGTQLSREKFTICIRICMQKPGGILYANLFSLIMLNSGLVVGLLGVEKGESRMYRELLFSSIETGR